MINNEGLIGVSQPHSSSTSGLDSTVITPQSPALLASNNPSSTERNTTTTSLSDSEVVNIDENDVTSIFDKNSPQSDADPLLQPQNLLRLTLI